jgi:hypothetical protein
MDTADLFGSVFFCPARVEAIDPLLIPPRGHFFYLTSHSTNHQKETFSNSAARSEISKWNDPSGFHFSLAIDLNNNMVQ